MGGDRATALIEDIWCEKIRGCSYGGGGNTSAARARSHKSRLRRVLLNVCYAPTATKFRSAAK
jgi:hypothetical protein